MRSLALALALISCQVYGGTMPPWEAKFQVRGYFQVASKMADPNAPGGYAPSENLHHPIDRAVTRGRLSLIAYPNEFAPFAQDYAGFHVVLANSTGRTIALPAQDSRIGIVRQALDRDGRWKALEYLPRSWCGNSYHQVFLPSGQQWTFVAPVYEGSFRTRMRFVLLLPEPIYSNEFEGSINPEQYTVPQGHVPTSIMDPYVD